MKTNYYTVIFLFFWGAVNQLMCQTILTPGDIAIIGIHTDSPKSFAFVTLKDIETGTRIFFTDSGILSNGSFRSNEGAISYTAPSLLTKGTVVNFTDTTGSFENANNSTVGNNGFNLSASGDQVIAFTGSSNSPTFIFAAQTNSTEFQTNSNDSNQSDLPTGLINGVTAVAVGAGSGSESEFDNSVYNLSVTTGTKEELLTAIANNANWNGSNTTISLPTSSDFSTPGGGSDTPNPTPTAITLIHDIQGSENSSPLVNQIVTIEGVIVGDFQDVTGTQGDLNGFFIQEEDSDNDMNTKTSEGIFVFDGSLPAIDVSVGDLVKVTGSVSEFFGVTQISNTTNITVVSNSNNLPESTLINLPMDTTNNSDGLPIIDLEFVEGMLIAFPQVLTVSELFNLDRFGEIKLIKGNRPLQYTQLNTPSVTGFEQHQLDIASNSITLDDGFAIQNPNPIRFPDGSLDSKDVFRMGNTSQNIEGVVHYSRGSGGSGTETFRIHPTINPTFIEVNPRPELPDSVGGNLKIASYNVLNFFTTLNQNGNRTTNGSSPRGANNTLEYQRQLQKLVKAITAIDADILGLIEIENDFLSSSSGNAIKTLVDALNLEYEENTYDWVNPNSQYLGGDAIAVGFIYKPTNIGIAPGTNITTLTDSKLPSLGLSSNPPVFEGPKTNRVPLAVSFLEKKSNEILTVVINHFKSKGSEGNAVGDTNLNDGVGSSNQTRLNAAIALNTWLKTDPTNSNDTDFLILGDLNAYAKEAPITYLENEGYTDLAIQDLGNSAYSFVFDSQIGTLDYALANSTLATQITGITEWHINTDEADAIDYNIDFGRSSAIFNENTAARNSDHDPVIIGLNLNSKTLSTANHFLKSKEVSLIKIYPIPLNKMLYLDIPNTILATSISILNIHNGAVIFTYNISPNINSNKVSIPVAFLSNGTYILKIETRTTNYYKLLVK